MNPVQLIDNYIKTKYNLRNNNFILNKESNILEYQYYGYSNNIDIIKDDLNIYFKKNIFKGNIGYLSFKLVNIIKNDDTLIISIKYDILNYYSYFDVLPIETIITIIIKLENDKDTISLKEVLINITNTDEFNKLWLSLGKDKYYNPGVSNILEHPLIKNIFIEFKKIFYNNNFNLEIKEKNKYIVIYHTDIQEYPHIRINKNTLDIYSASGKVAKGNLRDEPYHGINLIDRYGVIVNDSKLKKRLLELQDKK